MSSARSHSAENDERKLEGSISEHASSDDAAIESSDNEEQMRDGDDDDESVAPSILNDLNEPDFDEVHYGRNYDKLKDSYYAQHRCIEMLVDNIREKKGQIRDKNREIKKRDQKIKELENRLAGISEPRVVSTSVLSLLHKGPYSRIWIYRECCKQENMSQKLSIFHPDFSLQQVKISGERRAVERRLVLEERRERLLALGPAHHRSDMAEPGAPPTYFFPFQELPLEIQVKIFRQLFVKSTLIHCLSRLDPYNAPVGFPDKDVKGESQLPTRFHFGKSPCQIILACKPNDVLKPLLVCKRWYFIGVHAFYGANTFAFSSLGEWHRFCNGIGPARIQRLVNVELMWHGALMPRHETRVSQRTLGLKWLTKTRRLRTLVIHMAECEKDRTRRRYEMQRNYQQVGKGRGRLIEDELDGNEPDEDQFNGYQSDEDESDENQDLDKAFDPFETMIRRTRRHPNYRKFRSMRTVQGVDYLYQLRDMDWIRFKESSGLDHRQFIRDWSFLKDLNTVVTMPKQDDLGLKSHLENLTPLTCLEDFIPSEEDMLIVKTFYDDTHILGPIGGSETTGSANGAFSDTASWDGTSISDSDIPLVRTSQQRNDQPQGDGNGNQGDRIYIDDDDGSSSGLFVRSGSGSGSSPADPMEIDDPIELVNYEIIDLTGDQTDDEDKESSLFVHSRADTKSVKAEPDDDNPNNLYAQEETPPGSDDESDILPYSIPSATMKS
ncbi:hypothetical protein F4814DRAFT_440433 [Daldinia grandis]|nr:hypothetical protein F4814DRAFT_440433 [Daldinia grandis]